MGPTPTFSDPPTLAHRHFPTNELREKEEPLTSLHLWLSTCTGRNLPRGRSLERRDQVRVRGRRRDKEKSHGQGQGGWIVTTEPKISCIVRRYLVQ